MILAKVLKVYAATTHDFVRRDIERALLARGGPVKVSALFYLFHPLFNYEVGSEVDRYRFLSRLLSGGAEEVDVVYNVILGHEVHGKKTTTWKVLSNIFTDIDIGERRGGFEYSAWKRVGESTIRLFGKQDFLVCSDIESVEFAEGKFGRLDSYYGEQEKGFSFSLVADRISSKTKELRSSCKAREEKIDLVLKVLGFLLAVVGILFSYLRWRKDKLESATPRPAGPPP